MELVNLCVIVVCSAIMIIWALRKRFEINTMKIAFINEENVLEEIDEYER